MKWSQGYSNNDIEIIHKLSITLLVLICAYIVAYIIFLCLYERESQRLEVQSHVAAVILLLLWIACLLIFMLFLIFHLSYSSYHGKLSLEFIGLNR